MCRKIPKTLSGIETSHPLLYILLKSIQAGKYLKPYQGLKRNTITLIGKSEKRRKIPKTLSGIETFHYLWTGCLKSPENT